MAFSTMQIVRPIEAIADEEPPAYNVCCDDCNIDSIYKHTLIEIIRENKMDFEPKKDGDSCSIIWRIATGGCFARWTYYFYGYGMSYGPLDSIVVWEKCGDTTCCYQTLEVCRDYNDVIRIIQYHSILYTSIFCNSNIFNQFGVYLPCIAACNWNANLYGYYEFNNALPKRNIEIEYTKKSNIYGIQVFNYENTLKIIIRMNEFNSVYIKTYDLIGNQLDNHTFQCNIGENELRIHNNLPKGIYIYTIEVKNKLIKSDKYFVH